MATVQTGFADLADRYVGALYDLAEGRGALDAVANDLRALLAALEAGGPLRLLVTSPRLSRAEQGRGIRAVAEAAGAHDLTRNFLSVLAANRRLSSLGGFARAFLAELARRRGEVTAQVTTARPLTDAQRAALEDVLKGALGAKVSLDLGTDPSLIGGLIVRVGSRLVDASVATRLARLEAAMAGPA